MIVLVVEDDDSVAGALVATMEHWNIGVERASRGSDALLRHRGKAVILLDLGLPDLDGLEVLASIRRVSDIPIIVITARDDERSTVRALRLGADDFIVKPVRMKELLARIQAVHRRFRKDPQAQAVRKYGDIELDIAQRTFRFNGEIVELTRTEFKLMDILSRAPGVTVSRQQIQDEIWGDAFLGTSRSLDVHVSSLRAKLPRSDVIMNVRGVGYRLTDAEDHR